MPSFNQAQFIEESILSVLGQGYPDLELWVIDGGSTDGTLQVLKKYASQINWVSEPDRGQAHAINKGLRLVRGEIIGYLNSDDLLEPGSLEKIAKAFLENPHYYWLTGRCLNINEDGTEMRSVVAAYKNLLLSLRSYSILIIVDFIAQPATFWKRGIIEKSGVFDETLRYNLDYDFFLRLWRTSPPLILADCLAAFRIHKKAKTHSMSISRQYRDEDWVFIRRHTSNAVLLFLHDTHRLLITLIYALLP